MSRRETHIKNTSSVVRELLLKDNLKETLEFKRENWGAKVEGQVNGLIIFTEYIILQMK